MSVHQEKILFVIQRVGLGGAELFLKTLVNSFLARGLKPIMILLSEDNPILYEFNPEVKTVVIPRRYRYDLSLCKRIKEVIVREDAKKVFCIGAFAFFLSKLPYLGNPGVIFYLSLHTTVPFSFKQYIMDMLYLKCLSRNDAAIFICKSQKEYYKNKYGFRPKRSYVIHNGIDTKYFSPESSASSMNRGVIRLMYNIPADAKVILNVANVRPEKGHVYAMQALNILHRQFGVKAHLLIVGEVNEERYERLMAYVNEQSLTDFVHFAGIQKDVRPYLAAADIFTLTSYSETFSLAALEAMSFGLPCALTNIGGAAEMVVENKNGLLSKARDSFSIASSWHSLLVRKLDSSFIIDYASENFSSEKMVNRYLQVLSS